MAIYAAVIAAALLRIAGALMPDHTTTLQPLAGLAWCGAFIGFAVLYGSMLACLRR